MKAIFDDILQKFFPSPRLDALRPPALANRWAFTRRTRLDLAPSALKHLPLFRGQGEKRLMGILQTQSEMVAGTFRMYDYLYFGSHGKKTTTVLEYHSTNLNLSPFQIRPKGTFDSVKAFFRITEPLFATATLFNQHYQLSTEDVESTKIDLNEFFLDQIGEEEGWMYEGNDDYLIAFKQGQKLEVSDLNWRLENFERICERLRNGISTNEFV